MSRIIAVDTSSEACSAALMVDRQMVSRFEIAPRKHTSLILPMVDSLLAEAECSLADLDAVAFGAGPGSFTGLRIACGVAQAIAFAADLPVLPVSTLAALASAVRADQPEISMVFAALDARMDEVYWGVYDCRDGSVRACQEDRVCRVADLVIPADTVSAVGVGSGFRVHAAELAGRLGSKLAGVHAAEHPDARAMLPVAEQLWLEKGGIPAEMALPVYLREQVVQPPSLKPS